MGSGRVATIEKAWVIREWSRLIQQHCECPGMNPDVWVACLADFTFPEGSDGVISYEGRLLWWTQQKRQRALWEVALQQRQSEVTVWAARPVCGCLPARKKEIKMQGWEFCCWNLL